MSRRIFYQVISPRELCSGLSGPFHKYGHIWADPIGVGRVELSTPPPSEPDGRISRIRLSSRRCYLRED